MVARFDSGAGPTPAPVGADSGLHVVITTIHPPTPSVVALEARLRGSGRPLHIIGDQKGPDSYDLPSARLLTLAAQQRLPYELVSDLPTGHYARKNLGYLRAIHDNAGCIFETDDDNAPLSHWAPRSQKTEARTFAREGWVNVYGLFSDALIWPRGLPLSEVRGQPDRANLEQPSVVRAPIQQGLADGSPDVDAVWRLVLDRPFEFERGPSVTLAPGSWCPFNSQCTWWWPDAYPLLYLPSYCSFRMTDIWRGLIAQRCVWELGVGVVFHAAEMVQERNEHDLMRDFRDEIPGYTRNQELVETLGDLDLDAGVDAVGVNLSRCYAALIAGDFFPQRELGLVEAWLSDLERS